MTDVVPNHYRKGNIMSDIHHGAATTAVVPYAHGEAAADAAPYRLSDASSDYHDADARIAAYVADGVPLTRAAAVRYLTRCPAGAHRPALGDHYPPPSLNADAWAPASDCAYCRGTGDLSHLTVPCGRYGRDSDACAHVAWRVAYLAADGARAAITLDSLDYYMGLVVNSSESVAYMVRTYGGGTYR